MDDQPWKRAARPLPRRYFLRLTGLGLGAATVLQACGGSDDKKDAGSSTTAGSGPAKLSGDLKILMWSHFVPEYDTWFDKFATDWGNANGVKVRVDHIPHLQLPARHASEIAAQAGHDVVQFNHSVGGGANLYFKHLESLDDIVAKLGTEKGGWSDFAKKASYVDGKWMTMPDFFIRFPILYREDLWGEIGMPKGPDTWDDLRVAGGKLKAKGNPGGFGFANHADSNASLHGLMWSHGAKTVQEDGKTVAVNTPEMREALRFGKALFDEALTPDVLAWDDSSNNTLLASGKGSWIHNPISASLSIKRDKNLDLYNKIGIAPTPKGPVDRKVFIPVNTFGIWKFASNKNAARAFLTEYGAKWMDGYKVALSYDEPMLKGWVDEGFAFVPTIDDPKISKLTDFTQFGAINGYPGPPTAAAEEVFQSYVIPQTFAKVAKGTSIDDAVKDMESAIKKIYEKYAG
jgi:multiple sugar transport system substrate-binding protein